MTKLEDIKINTLQDLKLWLDKNFSQTDSVWRIYPKKSSELVDFGWSEIVDVLLCYGWVDSLPRKVDEIYTSLRISPRNPKSRWSRVNKEKVKTLTDKGLMHQNGLKLFQIAKENGAWNALNEVEELILPKDFREFLENQKLLDSWHNLSRSFKRGFLERLLDAKTADTRQKRFQGVLSKIQSL
jgi:uncharacterized protein YdeI (YjbR/CyaY-like superfamily)